MFNHFKHWFIPHEGNAYKPLFLRIGSVASIIALSVFLFVGAAYFERTIRSGNLAAVISSVLVDLANTDRASNGLGTLTVNDTLVKAAQLKANDMAAGSYFAHTSPAGLTPWHWFKEAGYTFEYAGENLAVYFSDSVDVERAWMNSPSHRANILNGHFTEIGIATAQGTYQGQPTVFVVQMFGSPATPKPKPVAQVTVEQTGVTHTTQVAGTSTEKNDVAGASLETHDQDVKTIVVDENFIAVKSASNTASTASPSNIQQDVSSLERILVSPKTALEYVYILLAILTGFALALFIGIELKHQHLLHAFFAVLIIAVLVGLLYINHTFVLGGSVLVR